MLGCNLLKFLAVAINFKGKHQHICLWQIQSKKLKVKPELFRMNFILLDQYATPLEMPCSR